MAVVADVIIGARLRHRDVVDELLDVLDLLAERLVLDDHVGGGPRHRLQADGRGPEARLPVDLGENIRIEVAELEDDLAGVVRELQLAGEL
ncbi:MAG: hypothetical protein CMP58_03595 [Flavobacteriales bacterium]|nr:hypothetical protein [Flavobacteriales bacterium]